MAYPPGTVFAGFVLHEVLGAGGMGTVYLARHPRLPRYSALKLLSPELSHDPDFRRRFEQEAELAARLNHPNVVSVHDRGIDWGQLWIEMQFVEGEDCAHALAQAGRMPPERVLRILTEVGKGLDYAHRLGLLHRDVKPGNILLAPTGDPDDPERVMLTDFGVAKAVDNTNRLTSTGSVVATLAYAAPEQIQAGPLDHRVDIYALGCVLYELLTGEVPFPAGNAYEIMGAHLSKPPPRPTALRPDLSAGFDVVVGTALAKNREDRYSSCRELTTAAWQALRATAPPAELAPWAVRPSPPPPYPPRPPSLPLYPAPPTSLSPRHAPVYPLLPWTPPPPAPPRRKRRGVLGRAVATAVLLASAGAAFVVPGDDRDAIRPVALDLPRGDPLPDTHGVVVLSSRGNPDVYVVDVVGKQPIRPALTTGTAVDRSPALAPDRATVAYVREGSPDIVRVVAVDGTGDRPLFPVSPAGCESQGRPSWHPTLPQLVLVCASGEQRTLRLVSTDGRVLQVYDLEGRIPLDPAFAPDGSRIVYSAGEPGATNGGSLYTIAADGRSAPVRLTDQADGVDGGPVFSPDGAQILFRRRVPTDRPSGNLDIFVMDADGTDARAVASDPAADTGPGWSPDGTRIVFMSERTSASDDGLNHLWIIDVDGTGLNQVLRGSAGEFGHAPSWAAR